MLNAPRTKRCLLADISAELAFFLFKTFIPDIQVLLKMSRSPQKQKFLLMYITGGCDSPARPLQGRHPLCPPLVSQLRFQPHCTLGKGTL